MRIRPLLLAASLSLSSIAAAQTAPATQPPPGGVTDSGLEAKLVGLGYEPKKLSKGYLITVKRDTWTLYVQLVLSGDMTKMGMNANLGEVTDDAVTAAQWRDILISNGNIDPSTFYFDGDKHKLYLHRTMDNRSVTPAYLSDQINKFMDNIINTEATWKPVVH